MKTTLCTSSAYADADAAYAAAVAAAADADDIIDKLKTYFET